MGKSLRTRPKLERIRVHGEGSISADPTGKYTLADVSQWTVDRLFDELLLLRTSNRRYKQQAAKRSVLISELKRQRDELLEKLYAIQRLP